MPEPNKSYITTPIYYVNDRPHIGHVYTTTVADIVARYRRLLGEDVFFLTGTDEHAAKVVDAAAERGISPQQWADTNAAAFEQTFARLGITHNDFIRTSQSRHIEKVQRYLNALKDSGDVYEGTYEGWYDAGQEEYVTETVARENDYKSPINGKPLVKKSEKNYFFRLSAYRDQLLTLLEKNGEVDGCRFDVQPEARKNEIIARIREMKDVPISRSGQTGWGIPFPGDAEQTVYVWIDALFNYLTTMDSDDRRAYWQSEPVHLIAKDILWFHAAIWPAILLALRKCKGYEWVNLPRQVYAHSFWISEGQKMSKSLGNFIDLEKIDHYVQTFGLDALRYFLAAHGPMGTTDSDFSEAKFIKVYNSDLANTIGNSFSRVSNMCGKYFEGKTPQSTGGTGLPDGPKGIDEFSEKAAALVKEHISQLHLQEALGYAMELVRVTDRYIAITKPFTLAKDPAKLPEVGTILYNCAEALRIASVLLWSVMPQKMEALWQRIGCGHYAAALADRGRGDFAAWTKWGLLEPGTPIEKGEALFPRWQG